MANPEHLEILKRGVEAWNHWRKDNRDISPDLTGANLTGNDLTGADLTHADLTNAKLTDAVLIRTHLILAHLNRATLIRANLNGANVRGADFTGANLQRAHCNGTDLLGANLQDANLSEVDFGGADLSQALLHGADLNQARLYETVFGNTDLSRVNNLDSCNHLSPCILDHRTLAKSGELPLTFLRGCGLPDALIEFLPSLLNDPIRFYTCFISFTEADDEFSERLYSDLQGKGVRCWRWKEDAKWGKTLMRSIDEAVRVYDKLIVICTEQSLNAPAVIREIERALQKEDDLAREGKEGEVLFPIRLDDYIFTGWSHHRKADVVAKNVGDFRRWEQHAAYEKAFDRLLRDLKADEKRA